MQRNPQTPQGQRPVGRTPQAYPNSQQRPMARPQQPMPSSGRPAQRPPVQPAQRPPMQRAPQPGQRPVGARPAAPRPAAPAQAQRRPVQPQQRPQTRPVSSPAFRGRQDNKQFIIAGAAIALTLLMGALMQYVLYPGGYFPAESAKTVAAVAEIASARGVRINEVMTSNKTALSDENGAYPDWIELMNTSNATVDISGWALLDKASRTTYFTFPNYQLEAGETVVVFASGHLQNEEGTAFHAPFRLSSAGDTLMLSDENSTVVESMNIPALGANQSFARTDNGGWSITSEFTPGLANSSLNYAKLTSTQPVAGSTLIISEVMADNSSYPAPDGGLYDWIEITNMGASAVNLSGHGLSDNPDQPSRWKFPAVTLNAGQSIVVYTSSLAGESGDGTLYADFGLRAEGESILLYNPSGQVLDYVEFDNLKADQSLKRQSDGSYSTSGTPTPGRPN